MPYCTNCGQQIREGANFCDNCGSPVSGSNSQSTERKTVYEGDIHKCPACGEAVPSYQTICPSCGHEFRNTSSSNSIKEFENELVKIESNRKVGKKNTLAATFNQHKVDDVDQQLANRISNFAVPNNQEDIFEFMILAASNLDPIAYDTSNGGYSPKVKNGKLLVSNAWDSKYNQVHQKAKMMFPQDPRLIEIEALYSNKQRQIKKAKFKSTKAALLALAVLIAYMVALLVFKNSSVRKAEKLDAQFNSIVAEIQTDITNENYDAALVKAYTLHFDSSLSSTKAKKWDEQREMLIELINSKKGE